MGDRVPSQDRRPGPDPRLRPRSRTCLVRYGGGDRAVLPRQLLRRDDEVPRAQRGGSAMSPYRMDHSHYAWSPIVSPDRLTSPGGARVAAAFVISLGHYEADPPPGAFDPPTHRSPLRIMPPPDYPTVTHREYGHRVGIFRLFELFDAHAIRATAAIDALTADRYPRLVHDCVRRGWEVIAHGVGQRRAISAGMSNADERAYIRVALEAVGRAAGTTPKGWWSPEQGESARTPALLAEMSVGYLCDWANDDQPYLIGPQDSSIVSLPLMQEISD